MVLCFVWGTTWIGIKAGIDTVPPIFFAGTRFTVAGLLLMVLIKEKGTTSGFLRQDWSRLIAVSLLMISLCYGPLFWGMQFIDSGLAAVLELTLTPLALLGFALLFKQESFNWMRACSIFLGVCGIFVLFAPEILAVNKTQYETLPLQKLLGASAVASAAVIYAFGSVLARPLFVQYSTTAISAFTTFVGGVTLIAISIVFETHTAQTLSGQWGLKAWLGWLFLVIFGSLIGYQIYMRLLKEIGASAAGSYAFVSPAIAVVLGALTFGEQITIQKIIGMSIMLLAAYSIVGGKRAKVDQ
jgi:drug/metabolite transporter (DMT)-like permease